MSMTTKKERYVNEIPGLHKEKTPKKSNKELQSTDTECSSTNTKPELCTDDVHSQNERAKLLDTKPHCIDIETKSEPPSIKKTNEQEIKKWLYENRIIIAMILSMANGKGVEDEETTSFTSCKREPPKKKLPENRIDKLKIFCKNYGHVILTLLNFLMICACIHIAKEQLQNGNKLGGQQELLINDIQQMKMMSDAIKPTGTSPSITENARNLKETVYFYPNLDYWNNTEFNWKIHPHKKWITMVGGNTAQILKSGSYRLFCNLPSLEPLLYQIQRNGKKLKMVNPAVIVDSSEEEKSFTMESPLRQDFFEKDMVSIIVKPSKQSKAIFDCYISKV